MTQPRASLARVLDDLGATLLDLAHGDAAAAGGHIGGVAIHDRLDRAVLPPQAVVLGVGVEDPSDVAALLTELGDEGAAALVVRAPVPLTDAVRAAADAGGVALLGLSRGVPWSHLAELLRSLLGTGLGAAGEAEDESLGGLPSGDLFAVANAIASLLDAPVTIEDRGSRVLAFSGRQDEADPSRVETILGRQVPERYARMLRESGVFRELHRSDDPVWIEPAHDAEGGFTLARVAIAVRAGDELLGSVWAAVSEPLSPARAEALRESAKLVALHLLRVRAGSDPRGRLRADLLATALQGGAGAGEALGRLGLAHHPVLVLGVVLDERRTGPEDPDDAALAHERQRLADAFSLHLAAVHPRAAAAAVGDVTYGLLPVGGPPGAVDGAEPRALRLLGDFIDRVGDRLHPLAAVGPVAHDTSGLVHSRVSVDRTLRVLRETRRDRRTGRLAELQGEALVLELRDLAAARGDEPSGALARLIAYDGRHRSALVETLRAWLDHLGDSVAAAESLAVHQNTFRYRLRRVAEVGELDLTDADQRFAVMLQLRVLRV